MTDVALSDTNTGALMESVIIKGDLSKLTPEQRSDYYMAVCRSIGLNPLTQPFAYITLNGKLTLYALRACTDQLRKLHGISTEVVDRVESGDGLLIVHVRVKDKDGRQDEDYGAVTYSNLKGDAAANAIMKCVTKAKRRATLSLCGLGWLDESEIETVRDARVQASDSVTVDQPPVPSAAPKAKPAPRAKPVPTEPPVNPETGEVSPHAIIVASKDGKFDWIGFGKSFLAAMKSSKNADECEAWDRANELNMAGMKNLAPDVHARLMTALQTQIGYVRREDAPVLDKQVEATSAADDII